MKSIPEALREEQPWLLYWLGVCRMPFNLPEGRGHFEKAFERFKLQNDAAGIFLAWSGVVETYIYQWGDFKPLDKWIAEIEALLVKYSTLPSPEIEAKVTAGVFTALMYRQPQHPHLPVWTERLHRLIEVSPNASLSMLMGNHLLLYYTWWSGDLAKGTNLVNMLEPLSRIPDLAPLSRIAWHAIKAAHCWMTGDNTICIQAVEEGLKIAEATGVHVWDFMLLAQGVWGILTSGEIERVPSMFKRMLLVMDNRRLLDVCHYRYQAFIEAMHRNDVRQMAEHSEAALHLAKEAGVIWAEGLVLPSVARAYMLSGRQDEVTGINKQAMQIAQALRSKVIESSALQAEIEFAMEIGNESACLQALQKFFTLGREHDVLNTAWWLPSVMSRACAIALEHNIEVDYVKSLIRRCGFVPPEDARGLENWPWPLKIYTMGRFNILKDGEPIQFAAKAQHKPIELFKALIALGGRDVLEEQLTDILWPTADGDAAHIAFATTLKRLRQLIGHKEAVELKDGRLTLNPTYVWMDNWAFERLCSHADNALKDGHTSNACELCTKAIKLYHGHFLSRDEEPWAVSLRERLRGKFQRHIEQIGKYWENAGQWENAVECYQRAIDVDDLEELFYQQLMLAYQRLGRPNDAINVYHRCVKTLGAFGIKPSPATEAVYSTLPK